MNNILDLQFPPIRRNIFMLLKLIPLFFKYISPIFPKFCGFLSFELFCRAPKTKRKTVEQNFWLTGTNINLGSGRTAKAWGKGNTIWLLHGWASRGSTYYKLIPGFVNAGFKVIAWDAPAHGDSPGKKVNLISYTKAAAEDMKDYNQPIHAIVGHSFGGASLALLGNYIKLPPNIVTIGAPSEVPIIFSNYKRLIKLSDKAFENLVQRAEAIAENTLESTSLISNDLSIKSNVLVIHDEDDKEVPFKRFIKLKDFWNGGTFYSTKGLGHNRILKTPEIGKKIVEFISG